MAHIEPKLLTKADDLKFEAEQLGMESEETMAQLEALVAHAKALGQKTPPQESRFIHVVDDDEGFATAICRLLRASGYMVRHYANAGDFLLAHIPDVPGCILLDLCLPGPSGLDLQYALARRSLPLPIIFLSGHGDIATSVQAMKGGAVDFLTKPVGRDILLRTVNKAIARSSEIRILRGQMRENQARYEQLTTRETEVFEGVVAGKMNKEIASELGAAERTIKAHRAHVMQKMRVSSVAQLVHIADQLQQGSFSQLSASA
jgi:FixJ family two-component response regulator